MSRRLLIFGWHNVEGTWCFPARPGAGVQGLRRQFTLLRRTANVVALDRALDDLAAGRELPPRAVALTFDDGYRDNLDLAVPILEELGLPATFFLIPDVLDRHVAPWWERVGHAFTVSERDRLDWDGTTWSLAGDAATLTRDQINGRLKRLRQDERMAEVDDIVDRLLPNEADRKAVDDLFLDWDGARELARRASVGGHSTDHAILANEPADVQARNLLDGRRALERGLERSVELLAYPNGTADDFDDATTDAARAAGFRCGVTTIPGWNSVDADVFRLRRQVVHPERGLAGFKPVVRQAVVELRERAARS
jgi:peptidoglycan/xylan/chitin deacetylase (PgdA/CDA1 family)